MTNETVLLIITIVLTALAVMVAALWADVGKLYKRIEELERLVVILHPQDVKISWDGVSANGESEPQGEIKERVDWYDAIPYQEGVAAERLSMLRAALRRDRQQETEATNDR